MASELLTIPSVPAAWPAVPNMGGTAMANAMNFAMTHQGVRDLDRPGQSGCSAGVNVGATERALSSVGGAMLAGLGVSRGGLYGLALGALGAALIYRGSTGHCSLYAAAGMNTCH